MGKRRAIPNAAGKLPTIAIIFLIIVITAIGVPVSIAIRRYRSMYLNRKNNATKQVTPIILPNETTTEAPSYTHLPLTTDGDGIPSEHWDYIEVRRGAHMFWWFYGSIGSKPRRQVPLVLCMANYPGISSISQVNFDAIGPLDINLRFRNTTWSRYFNLLFIDFPVGVGYSYVDSLSSYATNDNQITDDLLQVLQDIMMEKIPSLQSVNFYIFAGDWGGKIASLLGERLINATDTQQINCAFKGLLLTNPLISPIHAATSWGIYLHNLALVDYKEKQFLQAGADTIRSLLAKGKNLPATKAWEDLYHVAARMIHGIDLYNVLQFTKLHHIDIDDLINWGVNGNISGASDKTYQVMNSPSQRAKLRIIPQNVHFANMNIDVYKRIRSTFLRPTIHSVDTLLDNNMLLLFVSGQFNAKISTISTYEWMKHLKWDGLLQYSQSIKSAVHDDQLQLQGFIKQYKNLAHFVKLQAGANITSLLPPYILNLLK